jgi:type I restriction enzyme S subunit
MEEIKKGFYENEKFGNLPIGWKVKSISQLFDFYPTSSYSRSKLIDDGEIGYIHYGDIHTKYDRILDLSVESVPFIPNELEKKYEKLKDGDLVVSDASEDWDGVGKAIEIINSQNKQVIAGLHTLHLRPKTEELILGIKGYLLNIYQVSINIKRLATGIKVYGISKPNLGRVLIPVPPKPEQTAIATLLSKVDEAIATTQNSIKAAEKLKKALMQNLLTGKLKPDGTWRTDDEFYVDEKFGKVPKGWEVKRLKEVAFCLDSKRKPIKAEDRKLIQGKYPYYGAAGIIDHINDYIFDGRYLLFGEDGENLISRKVPQAFIVEGKFWVNNHANILKEIENASDLDFLCFSLENKNYENIVYGSAQPKINKSDLYKIKLMIPKELIEQKFIAEMLTSSDNKIVKKQTKIRTLQRLKKSLMQQLLTGKVRLPQEVIDRLAKENKEALS